MTKYYLLIFLFFIGLTGSAIHPHDYFTWFLEVAPAIIGLIILCFTFKKFQFTFFIYLLILLHCYILFIGGHYTYAKVPLFDLIKEYFHQSRNNYDKIGHFMQGFVPTLIARELFIRLKIVKNNFWLPTLAFCVILSISAIYEILEWMVAVISKTAAESFLGTQGYVWDTQSDMFFAGVGSILALLFLSKIHDKKIANETHL